MKSLAIARRGAAADYGPQLSPRRYPNNNKRDGSPPIARPPWRSP